MKHYHCSANFSKAQRVNEDPELKLCLTEGVHYSEESANKKSLGTEGVAQLVEYCLASFKPRVQMSGLPPSKKKKEESSFDSFLLSYNHKFVSS
jgi:hypothetical protein